MQELKRIIAAGEDWLMERILSYAAARGYTLYTSKSKEAWRLSISGLSAALLAASERGTDALEFTPDDAFRNDPAAEFAITEARLHRNRGIAPGMFLGLLKYFRRSYLDLVRQSGLDAAALDQARRLVERFFDRLDVGIASEWCALPEEAKLDELRESNRLITNEKNRFLSLFESLANPVVFIDCDGGIQDMNTAAQSWLGFGTAGKEGYSASNVCVHCGPEQARYMGKPAAELFPWLKPSLDKALRDKPGTLSASMHLDEGGQGGRDVMATLTGSVDVSGRITGYVLVLQEVTDLSRSREQLREANRQLEAEVRSRTQALEDANVQLRSEIRERELYQSALTESASLYRAVVEDQGELICRFRPDGSLIFANNAYSRIFDSAVASLSANHALIQHLGQDMSLEQLLANITPQTQVLGFEQQAWTPSGHEVWYNWTCRGIFGADGRMEAYQLVGGDVTRAREAEKALRELNESLEKTVRERTDKLEERALSFERMNMNLQMQVESRKRAEEAQAAAVEELQVKVRQITALYGLAEVLGTSWSGTQELLCETVKALRPGWRQAEFTSGEIIFDDQVCRSENFREGCRCISRTLTVFGNERGRLTVCHAAPGATEDCPIFQEDEEALLTSMARQIERSLEAYLSHTRLAQSEREFRDFFDNSAEAVVIHDENGIILDASKNAGIQLNLPREDMIGANLLSFCDEEDRENMAGRFLNAMREYPELFLATLRRKDGFPIPLEILCQAQEYQGHRVLVSSGRNIAKRQKAEAEARRRTAQERLLTGVSSRMVNALGTEVPSAMTETLAEICAFVGMQRAAVYRFDDLKQNYELAYQWAAEGVAPMAPSLMSLGRVKTPWLYDRSLTQDWVTIRDASHLPPAAIKEKRLFGEAGLHCLTVVAMSIRGRTQGLFLVASGQMENPMPADPQLLMQFAPMFSNVMLRQRNRKLLNENANLLTSILNSLSVHLCVLDKRGAITLVNRTWTQSQDRTGPAMAASLGVGDNYLDFCTKAAEEGDAQAAAIRAGVASVLSGQEKVFRLEFSTRSGAAMNWYLLETTPRGKGARGAVLTHLNITARKRAERRLSRNEARYRTILEALREGLMMVRKGGIMSYMNDQLAKMLGYPKAKLLGRRPEEYVAAESQKRLAALIDPAAEPLHAEEIIWNHATGRHVYSLVSTSNALDDDGNLMGKFAVVTDTTERKGLESQLMQSQKLEAIGQLAAGIAHEINTPAQYVGNNVQFIKTAFADILAMCGTTRQFLDSALVMPPTREAVEALVKAMADHDIEYLEEEVPNAISQTLEGVERISTIVRSVKQFAHPGASVMATADLNEAMRSTVTVSRNEWKYVAELTTDLDEDLPPVVCMIGEINQVILNLIVNAAHAIADAIKKDPERKGRITLSTKLAPPWAEIRVSDTGTGIPPAVQAKIFDPFFTTKEVGKGTGQGLTISRTIVMEKHHGQLFFETEPGVGTTFVVRLPLEQAEAMEQ